MAQDPNSGEHTDSGFDWSKLIGPGAAIGAGLAGRALSPSPQQATQAAMPPELRQLLAMSAQRAQYQNPLFQAVSQQAFQGLPTYAKQGVSMGSQLPQMPSGGGDSGGMPDWLKYLIGVGAGSQARSMLPGAGSGSGGDLGKLVKALKGIFHRDDTFGTPLGATGSDPFGSNLPSYDPFYNFDPAMYENNWTATDPSGGTGIGPGMQSYYASNGITSNGGANPWDE